MTQKFGLTCKGKFRRANMKAYSKRMSEKDEKGLWNDTVAHILEDQGYDIVEDPRSIYDPEQLWTALERYSPEHNTFIDQHDPCLHAGIGMAWSVFAKPDYMKELQPLREPEQLLKAIKGEKFAGLPTMGKKRDDFIYGLDREKQVREGIKAPNPCLAGKRCQRGNKTRLVWMYPMEMTLMEARFARPLIDRFLDSRTTMAFGMKKFEIGALVDSICYHSQGTPVAMDYSKFDSSIPSYLIHIAFKILGTWFTKEDKEKYGFREIEKYFITTPIVMIDGNLYTGKNHGVPSGSYFTQLIDSIVNTMLLGAMSNHFKWGLKWTKVLVLGDDVIMCVKNPNLEEMKEYLANFGIKINIEKTQFSAHFLGADWRFGKPFRDFQQLLSMAVQPEGFKKMGKTHSERVTSAYILLTNYACTYTNAWRLLDKRFHSPQAMNYYEYDTRPDLMSGSDRFLLEYNEKKPDLSCNRVTLIKRFLA